MIFITIVYPWLPGLFSNQDGRIGSNIGHLFWYLFAGLWVLPLFWISKPLNAFWFQVRLSSCTFFYTYGMNWYKYVILYTYGMSWYKYVHSIYVRMIWAGISMYILYMYGMSWYKYVHSIYVWHDIHYYTVEACLQTTFCHLKNDCIPVYILVVWFQN